MPVLAHVSDLTEDARRSDWSAIVGRWAESQPDKVALRHGREARTYGELAARAESISRLLAASGVRPGDTVAVLSGNRVEVIDVALGVMRAGAILVPLNTRLSTAELAYQVVDCGAAVVLAETELLAQHGPAVEGIRTVLCLSGPETPEGVASLEERLVQIERDRATAPGGLQHRVQPNDPAVIIYTSGTTGRPKGAVLSHNNLLVRSYASMGSMSTTSPDEVWFAGLPLFHVGGLGGVLNHLLLGGCAVIQSTGSFDAVEALEQMASVNATSAFFVPTQWDDICAAVVAGRAPRPALRRLVWGAAPASPATLDAMAAAFPGVPNISTFGQSELGGASCILKGEEAHAKPGSVGRPLPGVAIRLVDDDMNDVAVGEVGEIVYQGPTVFLGYWGNPEATEEAIAGGWFHSGDLCRADEDGFIWVVDRKKDMIVSGGENVYSAEVESAISTHPLVMDVAVVGVPHERWGETPLAVVVPRPGAELTAAEVIEHTKTLLASYKKPSRVVFVDALPRNAAGKVLKTAVRQEFATS